MFVFTNYTLGIGEPYYSTLRGTNHLSLPRIKGFPRMQAFLVLNPRESLANQGGWLPLSGVTMNPKV